MEKGFAKITPRTKNLKKEVIDIEKKPAGEKNWQKDSRKNRKTLKIILIIFAVFFGLALIMIFPLKRVYSEMLKTQEVINQVSQAVENQDIDKVKTELGNSYDQLIKTEKAYSFFAFCRFIPFISGYYQDGQHLFTVAIAAVEAGQIAVEAIEPHADLLGLKGESKFVEGSADERIQTAIQAFAKVTPQLSEISQKIETVKTNLDQVNFKRYPEKIGDKEIRSKLLNIQKTVNELSTLFINAQPLLENLPQILGEPKEKKYLVLFQNDKELRPTGGFITAYAVFKLESGKPIVENSDDIYKLDERNKSKISPPKQFIDHLKVYNLHLRDSNFDPDFVDSMKRFEEMYNDISGTTKIDGIIAVDTHVLVEAMKILGPIPAYGTNFTTDNDPRCDCPSVIYELEEYAGRRVGYIREDRKDIIGVLLYQIMQKALGVSPSQYWGKLFQMMLSEFEQKHILIYLHNEAAQKSLEALNYAGTMSSFSQGDYLHINDANLGGAKSNMFVKHAIKQNYEKGEGGVVVKTLTIDYKNPSEGSKGCNLEAGGLCLNGLMPNWVRIYVPKGSELLSFEGSEDEVTVKEEYNRTVFEGFLTIAPNSVSQIKLQYRLPSTIESNTFPLFMQKQPGTDGHEMTIMINGNEVNLFNLTTDKQIEIKF